MALSDINVETIKKFHDRTRGSSDTSFYEREGKRLAVKFPELMSLLLGIGNRVGGVRYNQGVIDAVRLLELQHDGS